MIYIYKKIKKNCKNQALRDCKTNKILTHTPLLPLRLGMKTHTVLNKCDFIITVTESTEYPNYSGFLCHSEEK